MEHGGPALKIPWFNRSPPADRSGPAAPRTGCLKKRPESSNSGPRRFTAGLPVSPGSLSEGIEPMPIAEDGLQGTSPIPMPGCPPKLAAIYVENIRKALHQLVSRQRRGLPPQSRGLPRQLRSLESRTPRQPVAIPPAQRVLATAREPFPIWPRDYGLERPTSGPVQLHESQGEPQTHGAVDRPGARSVSAGGVSGEKHGERRSPSAGAKESGAPFRRVVLRGFAFGRRWRPSCWGQYRSRPQMDCWSYRAQLIAMERS